MFGKNKKFFKSVRKLITTGSFLVSLPLVASAAVPAEVLTLIKKLNKYILNPVLILLFLVAFLVFFWGVFRLITNVDDATERTNGKKALLWGVVGMTIMVSVYGIIKILLDTVGAPLPDILK